MSNSNPNKVQIEEALEYIEIKFFGQSFTNDPNKPLSHRVIQAAAALYCLDDEGCLSCLKVWIKSSYKLLISTGQCYVK